MTVHDLQKRLKAEDRDKVIILSDGKGWSNINVEITDTKIIITPDMSRPFSDER